jgi:hypothetical protein
MLGVDQIPCLSLDITDRTPLESFKGALNTQTLTRSREKKADSSSAWQALWPWMYLKEKEGHRLSVHKSVSHNEPKSSTPKPKSVATGRVPKLSFAVVVPSPPKRSTHKSTRVKRDHPEHGDSSQSQDHTPAAPDHYNSQSDAKSSSRSSRSTSISSIVNPTESSWSFRWFSNTCAAR